MCYKLLPVVNLLFVIIGAIDVIKCCKSHLYADDMEIGPIDKINDAINSGIKFNGMQLNSDETQTIWSCYDSIKLNGQIFDKIRMNVILGNIGEIFIWTLNRLK